MMKSFGVALAFLCLLTACKPKPAATTAPRAGATAEADPCLDYARRLCEELGPRTEACRAVLGSVVLLSPRACQAGVADFDSSVARIGELRKQCETVAANICAALGTESQGCQAIRQNLPDIPPGHCGALLRDQSQLIAALKQREALNGPLSEERWQALLGGKPAGFGAADAKVVVVEFSDFQCPYCAQAADTVHRLKEHYADRIRFVFRHFPLPFHQNAQAAAQAAIAAQDQGKFWEYHDLLFGNQDALSADALVGYARKLGLDLDAFKSTAQGDPGMQRVAEDLRLGESVQVQGTPTMFIDKKRIDDPLDYGKVSQAVEEALAKAP